MDNCPHPECPHHRDGAKPSAPARKTGDAQSYAITLPDRFDPTTDILAITIRNGDTDTYSITYPDRFSRTNTYSITITRTYADARPAPVRRLHPDKPHHTDGFECFGSDVFCRDPEGRCKCNEPIGQ